MLGLQLMVGTQAGFPGRAGVGEAGLGRDRPSVIPLRVEFPA